MELVVLEGSRAAPARPDGPAFGFFLLSLQRDVDTTLATLAGLGFDGRGAANRHARPGRQARRHGRAQRARRGPRRTDRPAAMTAVVTGGGSGIGLAVTERLRAAGDDVVVWDIDGGDIDCDISDSDSVSAAIDRTVADHGAPDRLVACAGIGASGLLLDQTPADWQRVIDTNLTGTWLTMRAVAQAMVDQGSGGSIVAVSSISGTACRSGHGRLLRVQGGHRHAGAGRGAGVGRARHPRQRRRPRCDPHADARQPRAIARLGRWPDRHVPRWAGSARPTISPKRSSRCSNCPGSQGRPSSPTAAWRCTVLSTPTDRCNA